MHRLFNEFKNYIIKNAREPAYKPTSEKYDEGKLFSILKSLDVNVIDGRDEEMIKVVDFVHISSYLHKLYQEFYKAVLKSLSDFNMKGEDAIEFFIAFLNKEDIAINEKIIAAGDNMPKGPYLLQDITNNKLSILDGTKLDVRAVMEGASDATAMLCNFMRHHMQTEFKNPQADPLCFTVNLKNVFLMADLMATFKHSYDEVLYDKTFVKMDKNAQTILFDFENYRNEILKALGHNILRERVMNVYFQNKERNRKSMLDSFVTSYRVKRVCVDKGFIHLQFGQGNPKRHVELIDQMQAAIDAYYEFLDLNLQLENLGMITLAEFLGVWVALQYICQEIFMQMKFNGLLIVYTKDDLDYIPRKISVESLVTYLVKLTGLKPALVKQVVEVMQVDWGKYNDIWSSPLYKVQNYYCLPFYPIVDSIPYNIIEHALQRGGYDLDKRGYDFERYVYKQISESKHPFPLKCVGAKKYGSEKEEIDLLLGLRNIVVLVEAKCIRYSMDPINYCNAWSRLEYGAEQALKKVNFMRKHPELFSELGDFSEKMIVPVVLTNYPIYTGFECKDVYIIDSHSFISYFNAGCITMRMIEKDKNIIKDARLFYKNEDEFSANFVEYLRENPIKKIHMKKMVIEEIPLLSQSNPWKCTAKTAVYKGNPGFDIENHTPKVS